LSIKTLLLLLAAANFVIGMGAFVVIGVLPPIAADFEITSSTAGWLMTAYALVYGVSSPILIAVTGSIDRARLLTIGMILFALGSFAAAAAPNFAILLGARGLMALGGGLVTPVAASIGAALVPAEARGKALATIFGGLTLAQVFGVPAGSWIGFAYGWRMTFLAIAALSTLGAIVLARYAPRAIKAPPTTLTTLFEVLRAPKLMAALSFTALFIGGLYVLYTPTFRRSSSRATISSETESPPSWSSTEWAPRWEISPAAASPIESARCRCSPFCASRNWRSCRFSRWRRSR